MFLRSAVTITDFKKKGEAKLRLSFVEIVKINHAIIH